MRAGSAELSVARTLLLLPTLCNQHQAGGGRFAKSRRA